MELVMNNLLHNHNIVAKIYAKGKISLPTTIKNDLDLHDGDNVIFIKSGNSWMMTTRNVLIKDAQNYAQTLNPDGDSLVDSLIDERKTTFELEGK